MVNNMDANIFRAISHDGGVSIAAIDSKNIVSSAHQIHGTSATVSAALGRALTAASLIGVSLKNEQDSVTLRFDGGGPIGIIIAVSDCHGNVRGCAWDYSVEPPPKYSGKLDVGAAVGKNGTLSIIKDIGLKHPHSGTSRLVSGEIAEDITAFYALSEQVPTACALGVLVDTDYSILAAGGYIAQLLPGASEDELNTLERNVKKLPAITELLNQGKTPLDIINTVMDGLEPEILSSETAEYKCKCSREKTEAAIASISQKDLKELIETDGRAEVCCNFCNTKYVFTKEELCELLNRQ